MQLVERHIVINGNELEAICVKSKNLYNQSLYYLRQSFFGKITRFSEYELSGLFSEFNDVDYRGLPAQTSQQVIKQLFKNWKAYFAAHKEWKKSPSKFNGEPRLPKYKKEQFAVYFTGQQVRLKDGFVNFPKNTIQPVKTNVDNVCQVRIIPQSTVHIIEIVYEKENTNLDLNKENFLSLDLGLSNLATSINNVGATPFIVNGNQIKSFNQWYNKRKSQLQSFLPKKGLTSKKIEKLTLFRNNWIDDKLHKISRKIVDYCVDNNIGKIIIGKNNGWKTGINLGSKTNQNFTNLPLARLISKIEYKAELLGISVICTEESYTSKCDSIALEPIKKHESYLGKRVKRGLFRSSTGKQINADANGAINIARKVIGDGFVKSLINSRQAFCHYKWNIL